MRRLLSLHAVVALFATLLATVLLAPPAHAAGVATVTGTVSASEGGRLSSVAVTLLRWNAAAEDWDEAGTVTTGRDGTYALDVPEAGSYVVEYFDDAAEGPYRRTAWGQGVYELPWEPGDPGTFTVRAGTDVPARDVALPLAPEVSGVVRDEQGMQLASATVELFAFDEYDEEWILWDKVSSDSYGRYTFQVDLTPGLRYTVKYSKRSNHGRFLGGGTSLPSPWNTAATRPVKVAGATTLPAINLPNRAGVYGVVMNGAAPVQGALVEAYAWDAKAGRWNLVDTTRTDNQGRYRVYGPSFAQIAVSSTVAGLPKRWLGGFAAKPDRPREDNHGRTGSNWVGPVDTIDHSRAGTPVLVAPGRVSGNRAVGQKLTAGGSQWRADGYVQVSYIWYRNGQRIPGARTNNYVLQPADAGQDVTVVTSAVTGTSPAGRVTAPTSRIAKLTSSTTASLHAATVKATQNAKVRVGVQVQATSNPTGRVQIFHGDRLLTSTTLTAAQQGSIPTINLPKLGAGTYTLRAVYTPSSPNTVNGSTSSWFQVRVTR